MLLKTSISNTTCGLPTHFLPARLETKTLHLGIFEDPEMLPLSGRFGA